MEIRELPLPTAPSPPTPHGVTGMLEELGAKLNSDDRRVASDLERFKEMVESQGSETGAWRPEVEHGRVERR